MNGNAPHVYGEIGVEGDQPRSLEEEHGFDPRQAPRPHVRHEPGHSFQIMSRLSVTFARLFWSSVTACGHHGQKFHRRLGGDPGLGAFLGHRVRPREDGPELK